MKKLLGNIVGSVAPTLGAALGGPLGGMAGDVISKVLGVENNPASLEKAIATASPEQLMEIKKAEIAFEKQMKELDVDIYKIEAEEPLYNILIDDVLHDYSDGKPVAYDKYKTDIDTDKKYTDGEDRKDNSN